MPGASVRAPPIADGADWGVGYFESYHHPDAVDASTAVDAAAAGCYPAASKADAEADGVSEADCIGREAVAAGLVGR